MNTSTNWLPISLALTLSLSFLYGEMKLTSVMRPVSANSLETSPMRRMFSARSVGVNPRLLLVVTKGHSNKRLILTSR